MNFKICFFVFFIISLALVSIHVDIGVLVYLIISYAILSLLNLRNVINHKFPLGELISLVFFIENTFAITMIYLIEGSSLQAGSYYYSKIPLEEFLPFSFLASQAVLIGYYLVYVPGSIWVNFLRNFSEEVKIESLFILLGFGVFGAMLSFVNIGGVNYVAHVLNNFLTCALVGFALYYKTPLNRYFLIGLLINLVGVIKGGMFGSLIYFLVYYLLINLLQKVQTGFKIKLNYFLIIGIAGFVLLAFVQNVKTDYRSKVWQGSQERGGSVFIESVSNAFSWESLTDIDFFLPILYRLNQGYQVSAVMEKVPSDEPFANGSTLSSSLFDAFIPRIIDPNKEEAGGRQKMARFTNLVMVGNTSMNIGLMGEAYANFGRSGGVVLLLLLGCLFAMFERFILRTAVREPILLILFPVYFGIVVGTGHDFLMLFNGVLKSSIIIFFTIYLMNRSFSQFKISP